MKDVFRELHRRSVWQVLSVYLVVSWGVLQVVDQLTEAAGLPGWTPSFALVLLLIGLPVVLATAVIQRGAPALGGSGDGASPSEGAGPHPGPDASHDDRATGDADLTAGVPDPHDSSPAPAHHRLFTWKRAILGGVAAFALLALSVAGYLLMWSTGLGPVGNLVAQGVIDEGDRVVLADFVDRTDAGLGEVVTEALRVDLQESAILSLVPPAQVSDALGRMGLDPSVDVTPERAREVAIRDGLKAVIQGDVGRVGSGYLLTASVVEPTRGDILASFRADAEDEDALLDALESLSADIREKVGESLRTIRAGPGLDDVTTRSLEALKLFAEAQDMADRGREMESIPLLEEAVRLDPDFAMAHRKLSVVLGNMGIEPERMRAAATRAYELRDRLTEREWGHAEAYYYLRVENDPDRALEAWQRILQDYPTDVGALNNAGAAALFLGRPADAEEPLRRLAHSGQPGANGLDNLVQALWALGKRQEALAYLDSLTSRYPTSRQALERSHHILGARREWSSAVEAADAFLNAQAGVPGVDILTRVDRAGYLIGLGRVQEGLRTLDQAGDAAMEHRQWEWYWSRVTAQRVWLLRGLHHPDPAPARQVLDAALETVPLDSLDARGDGAQVAALLQAFVGRTAEADAVRERIETAFDPEERGRQFQFQRQRYLLYRGLGRGDGDEAAAAARRWNELVPCPTVCQERVPAALAFELDGDVDAAIEAYESGLDSDPLGWVGYQTGFHPLAFERLGALYATRGDTARATEVWSTMLERYRGADEPIASRVRTVEERLRSLQAG